jgi:C-terminal processing protease CtpA/Prc
VKTNLLRILVPAALLLLACSLFNPGRATPTPTRRESPTPAGPPTATATPRPKVTPSANTTTVPVEAPETGPYQITGRFEYSNDIITVYYVEQGVALVDMYGFVVRDEEWEIPVESQTLGYLTLDTEAMTGEFWLQLPTRPAGTYVDVDNDGGADAGVQVFAVGYWPNLLGSPYSVGDDKSRGWPSYLASVTTDTENNDEVIGGKLIAWAPDDQQMFPTGFGDDGLLFTADDPVGPIPTGYSIVDLDQTPFAVSQEAEPELTLYEPSDIAVKDYSDLSYTAAFDKLFEKASTEWAFNGVPGKEVDWEAVYDEIAPRVAEAQKDRDALAFYEALRTFTLRIPDGHVGLNGGEFFQQGFFANAGGSYGMSIRELDDGRVIVVYLVGGGPAEQAGIRVGAEITEVDGESVAEAIGKVEPYFGGPFSLESTRRYFQAVFLLRNEEGTEADITYVNPGSQPRTVTLTSEIETDTLFYSMGWLDEPDPTDLPVEAEVLDSGNGYIKITSNYDDLGLIVRLFERALKSMEENGVSTLIIDLRNNGGGAPLGLAGFLYDEEIIMGQLEYYSEETGRFEPEGLPEKVTPYENQYHFDKIAVLVGRDCASACEIEAYAFSQIPGTIVVGYYPTAGVEAEVARGQFDLPEGMSLQISTGRFTLPDGSIFLEGTGVQPTLRVPITEENLLSEEDVELQAAEAALDSR